MIYSCNLVTSNIATVINNNNVPIGECFRVSWYTKQTIVIYLKARIKGLLTWMSRRRSLHSELKVLVGNVMASNIADGFIINLEAICITTRLPHGSICYIASYLVVLKVPCVVYLNAAGLWHAS